MKTYRVVLLLTHRHNELGRWLHEDHATNTHIYKVVVPEPWQAPSE